MGLQYPNINGRAFDFSSIEIVADGQIFTGVSEISYSQTLEPGILRGTSSAKLARTRGEYNAEGSLSMYLEEYQLLRAALGAAFMERSFLITVAYTAIGATLQSDQLIGCRITAVEDSHSAGSDALVKAITLDIMEILEDNTPATSDGLLSF